MKNGHINTALKALEKQITKYKEQAKQERVKANERDELAEFYEKQAQLISEQVEVLKKNELM